MTLPPPRIDLLIEFLADREEACPRCGYLLRGLTRPICPECGDELTLRVGLVEPKLGPYIAMLVAASLGFGAASLLGFVGLLEAPSSWWRKAPGLQLIALWIVSSIALGLVLGARRAIRKTSVNTQLMIAVGLWFVIGTLGIGIIATFDS